MLWVNVAIILSYFASLVQGHGYLIDRDLIAKKDGFKFNFHSGSGVVRGKGFHSLGCWKDTWIRAIQPLEKRHELLMDGNYKLRDDPLRKCAIAALDNKMKLFAIENGGQCLGDTTITSSYKKYGAAGHCRDDGYGGPWSMQVYGFTGAQLRRHGGYSEWSSWTKCSSACGKGIQKRFRTCSHPSPGHGGRDCSRLGPGMESQPCQSECLGTEDDELEDSSKTKASKKSDDTTDYLDDDDDDDDDSDNDDDNDDNISNNSEDGPNKTIDGKNTNQADESDSDTNPSYESTDKGKDVFKNSYAKVSKPLDHLVQYQGENIGRNPNAKVSKPTDIVGDGMDKTQSGSLVLKSTGDMIKSDGEMANDGSVLSKSNSKSANTVSEASTNIAFGNRVGNSKLSSNSVLVNGEKSAKGSGQSDLSKTSSDISDNGDTMKQSVSRLSQGTSHIQPGDTNENNDHSDKFALGNGLSDLPKTSSAASGVGGTMKQSTSSQGGKTKENTDQSANAGVENGSTMKNHLSDISNTQTSDDATSMKEPNTTDSELGDTEDDDEDTSDDDLSGGKSTMENDISDTSKSETSSNVHNVKESSQGTTDTKPGTTGENVDHRAGNSPSNDDDKSIMDNDASDASDSETSDNGAHMKDLSQGSGNTQPDRHIMASDESSSSSAKNDLPIKQQMKADQDLLRSRWLSLAKSGDLKPTPTKSDNSSKPVVDVSLKDDSEEDFEDKDMENEEEQKVNEQKVNEQKVNEQKVNEQKVNEQKVNEQKVNGEKVNEQKVNEQKVNEQKVNEQKVNEQKVNGKKVNGKKVNGEKIDDGEVDEQTDEWKQDERGRNVEETQVEEKLNDETTEGKNQEGHNENGEDIQMNDNQAVDGDQTVEHERKVDEPKMNEDSGAPGNVGDEAMNAPEMEKHVEPLKDHKGDESAMEETDGKEDGDVMNDKMSQEDGAKIIKEECICPELVCNHLADTGMFIDNTNVTDINDLTEMKAFAKGLAIGFKTEDKDVLMGIIANGRRSHIPDIRRNSVLAKHGWNLITHPKSRHANQARNIIANPKSRLIRNLITRTSQPHPKADLHIPKTNPKIGSSNQAFKRSQRDGVIMNSKFRPQNGHDSQAFKRAEAYLLAKQKKAIPPILNDVLFVLVSGAESDVEVHAPVKEMKEAGAKIVAIGVGKDAKIGKLESQADEKFMVPPGDGNAIVDAIVVAVCKKYLMGKPGPNTKSCPCVAEPSKKAFPSKKPDEANTKMTREEYKTGMFHASSLPKVDTSSMTSPQPSSTSEGTTLPTTSSTPPADTKKPLTAMSATKPSGEKLPAPETSPDTSGAGQPASSLAPDITPTGNQQVVTSSQPATQSKPAIPPDTAVATQATPAKATNEVLHIKQDKFKPLSKTLSTLGESLNKAHSTGELKEGSYALDTDIQKLLRTIGKLKSQVDSLRDDQEQLGSNDAVGSNQSGTVSEFPSQSEATRVSNSQPSSSMASTSQSMHSSEYAGQSQSNSVNESDSSKGLGNNTKSDSDGHIPLKLRIVGQTANKQQKNATILHLKLSDKIKAAKNKPLGKPLVQNPGVGNKNPVSHDTTLAQPTNPVLSGQTTSIETPPKPANIRNGDIPLSSTEAKQNKNLANVDGTSQNANAKPKRPQQTNLPSPANDAQQNAQTTAPSRDVKVSQSTNIASGATVKQPTNALGNAKQTTSPTTTSQSKTSLQDANPTKPNPQTSTLSQQSVTTTQKAKPLPSKTTKQITAPQTNTLPQESIATSQKPIPSKPTTQISPQSGITTGHAKLPQSNTITQQPFQESSIENTGGQLASTKPNAAASSLIQRAAQHKAKDFTAMESTLAKIVKTQQATAKSSIPGCNINLGFVLDGSASVEGTKRGNFLKMINFVKDIIHAFVELSQQVHVGTLVYSTNSSVILSFGTKGTEKVIDQILDSAHYPGQGSLTGKAIKDAWNQMFSSVPRGRKSKLLLLTDGPSNDNVKVPSKWMRDNGVEVFVIGLGKGYDKDQLQDMASLPSDKHIMIKDYDDLRTSVQEVRNNVCGFNAEQVLQIMTSARFSDSFKEINAFQRSFGRNQCILDVVFLLDGSRQVETNGVGNFQREINFVKKAAKYLPLSRNDVHIGVGLLGDSNVMVFPMNKHYTQNSIDYELDHIRYPASSDIQPQEIKYARQIMLMKGIRDVAPRVFVLVTDVSSIDSYRQAIDELRTDGSDVAMFGVGSDIYKQEVKVRSSVQGLVDQVVTLDNADESEAAKHFAINMCKLSNSKRTEIPRLNWKASDKVLNKN